MSTDTVTPNPDEDGGDHFLPLIYKELRRLAAQKMATERHGHTLQPTALVHEAYLRLLGPDGEERAWNNKEHFFAVAAEAMRRILIDSARGKRSLKRGGDQIHTTWDEYKFESEVPSEEVLAVDEALDALEKENPELAKIVKLRYFAGLSISETAAVMEVSDSTIDRSWRAARAWLYREISSTR